MSEVNKNGKYHIWVSTLMPIVLYCASFFMSTKIAISNIGDVKSSIGRIDSKIEILVKESATTSSKVCGLESRISRVEDKLYR